MTITNFLTIYSFIYNRYLIICQNNGNQEALKLLEFHRLLNRCLDKDDENIQKIVFEKEIDFDNFYLALKRKKDIFNIQ